VPPPLPPHPPLPPARGEMSSNFAAWAWSENDAGTKQPSAAQERQAAHTASMEHVLASPQDPEQDSRNPSLQCACESSVRPAAPPAAPPAASSSTSHTHRSGWTRGSRQAACRA